MSNQLSLQTSLTEIGALDQDQPWTKIFSMEVDTSWLSKRLHYLSQEGYLGQYIGFLNILCCCSLFHLSSMSFSHMIKANALETLILLYNVPM